MLSKDHAFYKGLAAVKIQKKSLQKAFVKSTRRVQQNARLGAKDSLLDAIDYRNAFNLLVRNFGCYERMNCVDNTLINTDGFEIMYGLNLTSLYCYLQSRCSINS